MRLRDDERGITMALTVMMVALIGVMGAGLITFAVTDLDSVSEDNRGQRAFEMAEAGTLLAKRQLRLDPLPTHYDLDSVVGSVVSPVCNVPAAASVLDGLDLESLDLFPLLGGNWALSPLDPTQGGAVRTDLDRDSASTDKVSVSIQWLNKDANRTDATEKFCATPPGASTRSEYFRVVSTGEFNGAKRRLESIYEVRESGVPKAYFALEDVTLSGNAEVKNVSIFSAEDVNIGNNVGFVGLDIPYRSWAATSDPLTSYSNPFNSEPRGPTVLGLKVPNSLAGVGAGEEITGSKVAGRDYGHLNAGTGVTYPFDRNAEPDLEVLREIAQEQQSESATTSSPDTHYIEQSGGQVSFGVNASWPDDSNYRTVVYIRFTGGSGEVNWKEHATLTDNCALSTNPRQGTLVVEGGNLSMEGNKAPFKGVVIVRGGLYAADGDFTSSGNSCLKGYANTDGSIDIRGNASPLNLLDSTTSPGFYTIKLWSWRERYD